MRSILLQTCFKLKSLTLREEGQDLVEYALVIALISIAAVATLKNLATGIIAVFTTIKGDL